MKNQFDLSGKYALVTGARGLAAGMADGLAAAGANVVLLSRTKPAECDYPFVQADLSDRSALRKGFQEAVGLTNGRLDILVNCAGIQRRHECEDFPMEDWDAVLEVNLTACFELCQLAGGIMLKQGRGKIINIASMISFFGRQGHPGDRAGSVLYGDGSERGAAEGRKPQRLHTEPHTRRKMGNAAGYGRAMRVSGF